ncbi:MAG TPA: phosphonate metabolism transcriptional regulator PhnF [Selenomonadales bacterium]|nr:phosphonate metabolism transcriptional regulator PhnF [Selenomonadales bacterium]
MIDRKSSIPYYCQLMEIVENQISAGMLKEGQQIPSEQEMSSSYRVNRHTVRQAIGELCKRGVLYKMKGRGTFVAKPPIDLVDYRLSLRNRFTENIRQAGKNPDSKLCKWAEITAPVQVAQALALGAGERVYELDILRSINKQPFLLSKVFLPAKYLPGLEGHLQDFCSLSALLDQYGIVAQRVNTQLRASFPSQEEAAALDIPGNLPVLKVENLLKTQDGVLIQYNVACYRGDLAKLSIDW